LLGGARLRDLASATDVRALAEAIARAAPEIAAGEPPSPLGIELATRREAQSRLAILMRWCGDRVEHLTPVFDAEDHRSIRAALRGAAAGNAPEERRAGLIATPSLGDKALDELCRQPTPAAVAALLAVWEHPLAPAILAEARREQPDLYVLERALDAAYAEREASAAKQGDRALRDLIQISTLAQRAFTALLAADPAAELAPLRSIMPGTPLAREIAKTNPSADAIERAALQTLLKAQRANARREPLGLGPVLYFLARLRAELRDLTRIAWGVAIDAPRTALAGGVISP
jgi:vacuolar-type H+-ATPase subunit C/Vma6